MPQEPQPQPKKRPGRPRRQEESTSLVVLRARVTPAEAEKVYRRAHRLGQSLSDVVRDGIARLFGPPTLP